MVGARGLQADAITTAEATGVQCPTTLGRWGRLAWREALATLVPKGNLAQIDLRALEMMCRQYEIWAVSERAIIEAEKVEPGSGEFTVTPNGHRQMSAERIAANRALREYMRMAPLFGATPVGRIRTSGTAQGDLFDWARPEADDATDQTERPFDPTDPFAIDRSLLQ